MNIIQNLIITYRNKLMATFINKYIILAIYKQSIVNKYGRWTPEREYIFNEIYNNSIINISKTENLKYSRASYYNVLNELVKIGICSKNGNLFELTKFEII